MALTVGTRLGPYEILSAIGSGGMGEVYKARDTRLDRMVAIKILPEALAADPQFRDRFEREAKVISSLDHPHICALYDVGREKGVDFLVMQYWKGRRSPIASPKARCRSIRRSRRRFRSPTRSTRRIAKTSRIATSSPAM